MPYRNNIRMEVTALAGPKGNQEIITAIVTDYVIDDVESFDCPAAPDSIEFSSIKCQGEEFFHLWNWLSKDVQIAIELDVLDAIRNSGEYDGE
jgi:hypothetical protein